MRQRQGTGIWIWAGAMAALMGSAAWGDQVYIQIEAKRSPAEAAARAAEWARQFPDLVGHQLQSGWYAMALGPLERGEAEARMSALKATGAVPADSYLSTGRDYAAPFWPLPVGAKAPQADTAAATETPPETAADAAPTAPAPAAEAAMPEAAPEPTPEAASPAPAPVEPSSPAEVLKAARAAEKALSPEQRQDIQRALEWTGHYAGAMDGDFGAGTRNAIAAWQTAAGVPPTGVLTPEEQARLLGEREQGLAALGLTPLTDPAPGMELLIPTSLVTLDKVAPPFAIYRSKDRSGVELYLISRPGDGKDLAAMADLVGALEVLPESAERKVTKQGFTIDGETGSIITHAEARLEDGRIRGFVLVWPAADRDRQARVLALMRDSFRPVGDRTLGMGEAALDGAAEALNDGLAGGTARATGSGFFVAADGGVLTAEVLTRACRRLTIDGIPARQMAADPVMNLAFVRPERVMAPRAVAKLAAPDALPDSGAPLAIAGFSWPGTLPAAVVTRGRVTAAEGAAGEPTLATAAAPLQAGDIGGPVLTETGTVAGLVLPVPQDGAHIYPPDFAPYRLSPMLATFLAAAGVPAQTPAKDGDQPTAPLSEAELARLGRDLTVEVTCY